MLDTIFWDNELTQRYDALHRCVFPHGERYTLSPSPQALANTLQAAKAKLSPLALKITANSHEVPSQKYLPALAQDAALLATHFDRRQHVEQLIIDLTDAEFLAHEQLRTLLEQLGQHFTLLDDNSGDYCISLAAHQADWSSIGLLRELGFNHLNVRLTNNLENQEHDFTHTQALIEAARTLQFKTLSINLQYNLPGQGPRRFIRNLQQVLGLQPDRLQLSLHHSNSEKQARQQEACLRLFRQSLEQLTGAGYRYIAPGLFSLPDDALAIAQEDGCLSYNLFGYSAQGHTVQLGLGLAAEGQLGEFYYRNPTQFSDYQKALSNNQLPISAEYHCTPQELICQTAVSQLRCHFRLDASQLGSGSISLQQHFHSIWPQLSRMAADGLMNLTEQSLTLKPAGRLLLEPCCQLIYDSTQLTAAPAPS